MKNIASMIVSYNPENPYVKHVIDELNKISDVILFTTKKHNYRVYDTVYLPESIGRDLVYEPRKWVVNNINRWKYFLYNEDDIFIPIESINNVIHLYETLPEKFIPGFIRYETFNDVVKYIDMHPAHSVHRNGNGSVKEYWKELNVWEPWNLHSGNWLFSSKDISNMIEHNIFDTEFNIRYGNCDQLESSASSLYLYYIKVYSTNFESVQCWHMPNKYIVMDPNNPTANELRNLINSIC